MDNEPHDGDRALLDRLNALKQSTITFETSNNPLLPNTQSDSNDIRFLTSDLTSRFAQLHTSLVKPATTQPSTRPTAQPFEQEPLDEEQSIEDILAELGPTDQWTLQPSDQDEISILLKEAQDSLPQRDQEEPQQDAAGGHEADHGAPAAAAGGAPEAGSGSDSEPRTADGGTRGETEIKLPAPDDEDADDRNDDREADLYLQNMLDELKNAPASPKPQSPAESNNSEKESSNDPAGHHDSLLSLPSTPSALHQGPPKINDSTEDPLSLPSAPSTALSLPSTPSSLPQSKKSSKAVKKHYEYTDEDINSWCAICNDDATIRCGGCESDLYCARCWRETHTGLEERGHQWVKYVRQ